ncbi:DUF202 domain-containing protein [Aeromicrobium sp. CTD01-1L150]|uniref:DUF202 domain-containing protein n=1 Tax=Aeromicrobium sp. CTD01-1L150 TaxID=3341830 RepID=UPI0035BFF40A
MSYGAVPPGLQQERTTLAWRRSTLAFCVVGLLVARAALETDAPVLMVVCLLSAACAMWVAVRVLRTGRWSAPSSPEPDYQVLRDGRLPVLVVVVAAVLCVAVALLSLGVTV